MIRQQKIRYPRRWDKPKSSVMQTTDLRALWANVAKIRKANGDLEGAARARRAMTFIIGGK